MSFVPKGTAPPEQEGDFSLAEDPCFEAPLVLFLRLPILLSLEPRHHKRRLNDKG